jgi:hypothetical protein
VCHLKRCLYGLKQSTRDFNVLLRAWLVDHGWQQCVSNPCIYIFRARLRYLIPGHISYPSQTNPHLRHLTPIHISDPGTSST